MIRQSPFSNSNRSSSVGKLAIAAIALASALFFGLLQFSKRQLHPPMNPVPSIVLLPSKVAGAMDTTDSIYLTDAVPQSLSALLAQVRGLAVKTPDSIEVERVHGDLSKIAEAYQVSTVLTSEIKVEGDDLTLSVQIVDPRTHDILWSHQYLSQRNGYNELLRQAADGVGHALQPGSPRVTATTGLAATSEAEWSYRQGEYYFRRYRQTQNPADSAQAVGALQKALALDPKLAAAAADIATLKRSGR